jgi:hypothetical protein
MNSLIGQTLIVWWTLVDPLVCAWSAPGLRLVCAWSAPGLRLVCAGPPGPALAHTAQTFAIPREAGRGPVGPPHD